MADADLVDIYLSSIEPPAGGGVDQNTGGGGGDDDDLDPSDQRLMRYVGAMLLGRPREPWSVPASAEVRAVWLLLLCVIGIVMAAITGDRLRRSAHRT